MTLPFLLGGCVLVAFLVWVLVALCRTSSQAELTMADVSQREALEKLTGKAKADRDLWRQAQQEYAAKAKRRVE